MDYVKTINLILSQKMYHHFDRFYLQLVPQHIILQNVLCFVPILKEYIINEYTVRDSFLFCYEIQIQDSSL